MGISPSNLHAHLELDLLSVLSSSQLALIKQGKDLNPDVTPRQFAASALYKSLLKKYEHDNTQALDEVALNKFLLCNRISGAWSPQPLEVWYQEIYGSFKEELYKYWNRTTETGCRMPILSHEFDVLDKARTGPGAAVSANGDDFYTKLFASRLGCTDKQLYLVYKRYISKFPVWSEAEKARESRFGGPHVVPGSRLSFVPKNDKTSRTICVEPNLNVFYQLGLADILNSRLKSYTGIDLVTQQVKNRELARRGSISNKWVTIDLESASDSISANMLWHVLPADFLYWLERYRCKETDTPRGREVLGMISSMGNGYTFSLQTILFTCLVLAVYRSLNIPIRFPRGNSLGNFGVNGDDIVVRRKAYPRLRFMLTYLGFKVNDEKSFVEGPFRESCGGDYFRGHTVRGVYLKHLDTEQSRYVAINRLVLFSARTGIYLPRSIGYLLKRVKWRPIPWWEDDSGGIKTPEYWAPRKRSSRYQSRVYYSLVPPKIALKVSNDRITGPRRTKRRFLNPLGLWISFLQGSVVSSEIGLRHRSERWKETRRVAPNWTHVPSAAALGGRVVNDQSWAFVNERDLHLSMLANLHC